MVATHSLSPRIYTDTIIYVGLKQRLTLNDDKINNKRNDKQVTDNIRLKHLKRP